jgi:TPR repeat protein
MTNLALTYDQGIGTEVDKEIALDLYLKAADKYSSVAMYNLGLHFYSELKDYEKSREFFEKYIIQ